MESKIGIVMTYHNRPFQLNKTLESINKQNYTKNLEVVIVDDNSDKEIQLPPCNFNVKIIRIGSEKTWTNPEPAYNKGFLELIKNTDSEIIISQNAECFHVGNILQYAADNVTRNNYITFGCYSINYKNTFDENQNITEIIQNNPGAMNGDRTNGWYNHPVHRPVELEWCAAIHRENIIKLNGYDERLAFGYAHGDGHLLHRIKLMNLKIEITSSPFVVHQWHSTTGDINPNKHALGMKNLMLFKEMIKENKIEAIHSITPDFK